MATASAKKVELFPDEQFIQDAMRSGRCVIQELSMKALGTPDTAYQAREVHLDINHVRMLEGIARDNDGKLGPVVVFSAAMGKTTRYILADGFHRHAAMTNMRAKSIRAYVVESDPSGIEREARLFATMCNRRLCLPRKPEDVKKAVEMLFADPVCWGWTDNRIAKHCRLSSTTVMKYRCEFSKKENLDLPEIVIEERGRKRVYRKVGDRAKLGVRVRHDRMKEVYRATIGKKSIYLGSNKEEAEKKFASMILQQGTLRATIKDDSTARYYLGSYGYSFSPVIGDSSSTYPGLRGFSGYGFVVVAGNLSENSFIPWVVGCLQMLRLISSEPAARMVVLCCPEDGPAASIDLAKKLGIEFLTPDQLVASLKGDQSAPDTGEAS